MKCKNNSYKYVKSIVGPFFAFLLIKIRMWSNCRYSKLVADHYFRFSDCKNCNLGAAATCILELSNVPELFCFATYKNYNIGATMPVAAVPIASTFLFNISLAIFVFSLVKIIMWE